MGNMEMPADSARTARDYDALPYPSFPYAWLHPGRLAALAILHGLPVARVETSRVLELGCAAGGNLIPLAAQYPHAEFIGVDLSARHVEDGQQRIAALGLTNIELRQADLNSATFAARHFDTILCHGVFSWVPPAVQQAILRICTHSLAEHGIAAVSYNVLPGWHLRRIVRDICLHHAGDDGTPLERATRARQGLRDTASLISDDVPYAAMLRQEVQRLEQLPLAYLMGEFLAEHNHAFHFHEFNAEAKAAGLAYLCEGSLSASSPDYLVPAAAAHIRATAGNDVTARESATDIACGRRFRRSLLIHGARAGEVRRDDLHTRLATLHFASPIRLAPTQDSHDAATFIDSKARTITLKDPLVVDAFRLLAARYPSTLSAAELLAAVGKHDRDAEARLGRALIRLLGTGRATVSSTALAVADATVEYPRVWPMARCEAASNQPWVTGRNHLAIPPPPVLRRLMPHLDGSHTREWIDAFLRADSDTPPHAPPVAVDDKLRAHTLDAALHFLARHALLEA